MRLWFAGIGTTCRIVTVYDAELFTGADSR